MTSAVSWRQDRQRAERAARATLIEAEREARRRVKEERRVAREVGEAVNRLVRKARDAAEIGRDSRQMCAFGRGAAEA